MKLPFIGKVITEAHHQEIVAGLRESYGKQLEALERVITEKDARLAEKDVLYVDTEAERRAIYDRHFESLNGVPLFEALSSAGEPAKSDEKAPFQEVTVDAEQKQEVARLNSVLQIAARRPGLYARQRSHELASIESRADEKRKVKEMLDLNRLAALDSAEKARQKEFELAGQPKPTPAEAQAAR